MRCLRTAWQCAPFALMGRRYQGGIAETLWRPRRDRVREISRPPQGDAEEKPCSSPSSRKGDIRTSISSARANAPRFTAEEMEIIRSRWTSRYQYHQPTFVRADDSDGYAVVRPPDSYPHMLSPWLTIGRGSLLGTETGQRTVEGKRDIYYRKWTSSTDRLAPTGQSMTLIASFSAQLLTQLERAVSDGVRSRAIPVSILDNFEWLTIRKRFGSSMSTLPRRANSQAQRRIL